MHISAYENVQCTVTINCSIQLLLNCWGTLVDIFYLFKMETDEIFNWKQKYACPHCNITPSYLAAKTMSLPSAPEYVRRTLFTNCQGTEW